MRGGGNDADRGQGGRGGQCGRMGRMRPMMWARVPPRRAEVRLCLNLRFANHGDDFFTVGEKALFSGRIKIMGVVVRCERGGI